MDPWPFYEHTCEDHEGREGREDQGDRLDDGAGKTKRDVTVMFVSHMRC